MNGVESSPEPFSELHRVINGPEVDEERAGLVVEHVIMDSGGVRALKFARDWLAFALARLSPCSRETLAKR
jgi:hypothetical protein